MKGYKGMTKDEVLKMEIGIIEADGGMWEIEARRNVTAYLRNELMCLIEAGKVVVSL